MHRANRGDRIRPERAARIVFALALIASAALLLHYRLEIGFIADDWSFLGDRSLGGINTLLEPQNENIVMLQAALYRVFYLLFGVGSAVPLQVFSLLVFLSSVVVFFLWVRERVGEWIATFGQLLNCGRRGLGWRGI